MANTVLINYQFSMVTKPVNNLTHNYALNSFIAQLNKNANILQNNFTNIVNTFNSFIFSEFTDNATNYIIGLEKQEGNQYEEIVYKGDETTTDTNIELERRITYIENRINALKNSFDGWVPAKFLFYQSVRYQFYGSSSYKYTSTEFGSIPVWHKVHGQRRTGAIDSDYDDVSAVNNTYYSASDDGTESFSCSGYTMSNIKILPGQVYSAYIGTRYSNIRLYDNCDGWKSYGNYAIDTGVYIYG